MSDELVVGEPEPAQEGFEAQQLRDTPRAYAEGEVERRLAVLENVVWRLVQANRFYYTTEEAGRLANGEAPFR